MNFGIYLPILIDFIWTSDNRSFDELSPEEKEHRISEVASRLKFIGDRAVEKFNSESSSSGVESPHREVGGHRARPGMSQYCRMTKESN
jgi:hypothetical protein